MSARRDEAGKRERKEFGHAEVGRKSEFLTITAELISKNWNAKISL